jgi:hypothetical protein
MPKRVITTATYSADARDTFQAALDPQELQEAMKGIAVYDGLPDHPMREGDTYHADVTTFRFSKIKGYELHLERVDKDALIMQSREKGGAIKRWDHHLSVLQDGELAVWTDDVVIDAGLLTPIIARFAAFMYRRRHISRSALSIESEVRAC